MKFAYSPVLTSNSSIVDSRGKTVKRPILMLELRGINGEMFEMPALVDSGADTTTVNLEVARALGIQLGEEGNIIGIGKGKVKRWMGHLPFKIKQTSFELDVPAWYIDSENVNVLLGQEVFFDTFRIKFEKDHDTFEILSVSK